VPTRIYALAKELQLDSKELVDVCTKAGITGKGSALASLDDHEVDKVKSYLAGPKKSGGGGSTVASAGDSDSAAITRDDYMPAQGDKKVPVLGRKTRPGRPAAVPDAVEPVAKAPLPPVVEAPPEVATPEVATPEVATPEVVTPEAAPTVEKPIPTAAPTAAIEVPPARPVDPLAPVRGENRPLRSPRNLGARKKVATEGTDEKPKVKNKRKPVINIAQLPNVAQPTPKPKQDAPAQKPVLRLPQDVIDNAKKGRSVEQLTKQAENVAAGVTPAKPDAKERTGPTRRRDGTPVAPEADKEKKRGLAAMASARADRQKTRRSKQKQRIVLRGDDEPNRGRRRGMKRRGSNTAAPRKEAVGLQLPCTVRTFSEAAGVGAGRVIGALMNLGQGVTINSHIPDDLVEFLAESLGVELSIRPAESEEESLISEFEAHEDSDEELCTRPPVVTFLGHVDHGKTSLLDAIIGLDVVSGEAGGITQHIRAYSVDRPDGRPISFVDTPGHEAFTEMRARGANVTDIAILVIAADDGIMPQTEEAISHAKAAGVPIIVALNKVDIPGVDLNRTLTQMTEHELTPSEWGGDIEVIRTSAIKGDGIDDLLECILTVAEINDYKANPDRPAQGICLEAEQETARGVIAKMIVQNGTLKLGDAIVCGTSFGRVKAMYDTLDVKKKLQQIGPSEPAAVIGLDSPPGAGDSFYVVDDISRAREIAEQRADRDREFSLSGNSTAVTFAGFQKLLEEGRLGLADEVTMLNLIIRADTRGSIEAIEKELSKLEHPEVQVKILLKGVGGITVGDVTLAHASHGVVVGFNVIPDEQARAAADEKDVEIRRYDIIYKVTDDIRAMLEGKLKPEERVVELGRAICKQVFSISRVGTVAGCYVAQGIIERGCRIRVNRDGRTIGDYSLDTVRHIKDDVREVPRGMECGIKLRGFNDIKKDDILEAYKVEEVARTL
jgi:translation initiation factor IF-2